MLYNFRFLTRERAKELTHLIQNRLWFRVGDVLDLSAGFGILERVNRHDLSKEQQNRAYQRLDLLHRLVHKTPQFQMNAYQDLNRVLDIFIRMNSGGTVLSHSDSLFSIAVANWQEIDARYEVNELVNSLNGIGGGFTFSKDFVLKAGLMLAEIKSVGFEGREFRS